MKKLHENFLAPKREHELKHKFSFKEDIPQIINPWCSHKMRFKRVGESR